MLYRAALLPCALVLACSSETPTTLAPSQATPDPALAAEVIRGPIRMLARTSDADWTIAIGGTVEELAAWCTTGTVASFQTLWEDLFVIRREDKWHFRIKGRDVPAVLYQGKDHDFCAETVPAFAPAPST